MKITVSDLEEMLANVEIDDEDIAKYLTAEPDESAPLTPRVFPDRDKVEIRNELDEMRVEAALAFGSLARIDRWRRQQRFDRDLRRAGSNIPPVIYAEGDSWFQFPFMLRDLVNQLSASHLVWCTSEAGDTLEKMVFKAPEYLNELHRLLVERQLPVRYFLFSGAGNDVVGLDENGRPALAAIVRDHDSSRSVEWHIETPALVDTLAYIEKAYRKVLDDVDMHFHHRFPELKVVIQGYDYSPTRSVGGPDRNRPVWARDWTGEPLREKGFPNNAEATKVVAALIDRLNAMTKTVCQAYGARAVHADLRGSVGGNQWIDELHPSNEGFGAAAARLRQYFN
jgi:hypothetical protein